MGPQHLEHGAAEPILTGLTPTLPGPELWLTLPWYEGGTILRALLYRLFHSPALDPYVACGVTLDTLIRSFIHRGLRQLFETGHGVSVPLNLRQRCSDRLQVMDAATKLEDMNLSGYRLHPLHTDPVRYSIHVNGPWAITFEWEAPEAIRVNLEQYH